MIGDKIRAWASTGTKTEPTNTKKDTGWLFKERPPFEWFNWLQNEKDKRINGLLDTIQSALGSTPPADTSVNVGRRNPLGPYAGWNQPWTDQNAYEVSASSDITDVCVGWDSTEEYPIIFLATKGSVVAGSPTITLDVMPCWQYGDDLANIADTRVMNAGFNATIDSNFLLPMICAGGYLYVVVTREGASGGGKFLQKYSIADWTGTPIASNEWVATAADTGRYTALCEADDDTLALAQITSANNQIVHFADKDAVIGTASTPVASRTGLRRPLDSDGTYLYFSDEPTGGGQRNVSRMSLSTKTSTTVSWTTNYVLDDMRVIGDGVVVGILRTEDATSREMQVFMGYDNAGTWTKLSDDLDVASANVGDYGCIGFDGIKIYIAFDATAVNSKFYAGISTDRLHPNAVFPTGDLLQLHGTTSMSTVYAYVSVTWSPTKQNYNSMSVYDGRDLWFIHNIDTRTMYRVTAPSLRHTAD